MTMIKWKDRFYNPVVLSLSHIDATGNTTVINTALGENRLTGRAVYIPEGRWPYNGPLWLNGAVLAGESGTILVGSDGTETPECCVFLTGYTPGLFGLSIEIGGLVRGGTNYHNAVTNNFAHGSHVQDVRLSSPSAYGLSNFGSRNSLIERVCVYWSIADGIHNTYGSADSEVFACTVVGSGDDYFPVISYMNDQSTTKNILIHGCTGDRQSGPGRGLVVDGGESITFRNCIVRNVTTRGIYITTEDVYSTRATIGVLLEDIEVDGCGLGGMDADEPGAAGVWVGKQSDRECKDISTIRVVVKRATGPASYNYGNLAENVDFSGVSVGS